MNVPSQSVERLFRLGYTAQEAQFIYLVAIHSGYFTRRQFLRFAHATKGKQSQTLLDKLLLENHGTTHSYQLGERVYHVFARKIFKAIGHENLRTRRKHQLDYIKTRLMALDFVLSNPSFEYLVTESDKVDFFAERMHVQRSCLPSRTYSSHASAKTTTRYFVDRFPLYIKDPQSSSPIVTFTYLDPGFAGLSGFGTHLRTYLPLFHALNEFHLVYVDVTGSSFAPARAEFSRVVLHETARPSKDTVIRYFSLRKAWESGSRVKAVDVVFLNTMTAEFENAMVDSLYRKWRDGLAEESEFLTLFGHEKRAVQGTILTLIGGESLCVFRRPKSHHEDVAGSPTSSLGGSLR
jgi:hypothetical protein